MNREKDLRRVPYLMKEGMPWSERREEIRQQLTEQVYGMIPGGRAVYTWTEEACEWTSARENESGERHGGKTEAGGAGTPVCCRKITVTVEGVGGKHSFPFRIWIPEDGREKHPAILYLGVMGDADEVEYQPGDRKMPPVWLLDEGYALAVCMAVQVEKDEAEGFPAGLVRAACGERREQTAGALAAWAEGLRIALDVLCGRKDIDEKHIAVAGLSRCGKAALWCGAQDERVFLTVSFDSGCGGAAISSGKQGERLPGMNTMFPHWMCLKVREYKDPEADPPFEQNQLLGLIAPRKLLITSSTQDLWSDPYAEFLGLAYAGEAYEQYGMKGIGTWIQPPKEQLLIGDGAAYYLREGEHCVEEGDWKALTACMKAWS